jgi:hypothetical protein
MTTQTRMSPAAAPAPAAARGSASSTIIQKAPQNDMRLENTSHKLARQQVGLAVYTEQTGTGQEAEDESVAWRGQGC